MNIEGRYHSLVQRHQELEFKIEEEMRRPWQNDLTLHALKRQKLAIKDELETLEPHRTVQ